MLDILKDKIATDTEKTSLSRMSAFGATLFLSAGFLFHAYMRGLTWELCIAYPVGVAVSFTPQLLIRLMDKSNELLKAWRGIA